MQQCDVPKGSPHCSPASNKSRYDTISVSLVSVFLLVKKSSQHAHRIHEKTWSLLKVVELQWQDFQILRCGFSENWGKEIGFRCMDSWRKSDRNTTTSSNLPMAWLGFPPFAWLFAKKAWLALVSLVTWSEQVNQRVAKKTDQFCDEERHQRQKMFHTKGEDNKKQIQSYKPTCFYTKEYSTLNRKYVGTVLLYSDCICHEIF